MMGLWDLGVKQHVADPVCGASCSHISAGHLSEVGCAIEDDVELGVVAT